MSDRPNEPPVLTIVFALRLLDWLNAHPQFVELITRAFELEEEAKAA